MKLKTMKRLINKIDLTNVQSNKRHGTFFIGALQGQTPSTSTAATLPNTGQMHSTLGTT
jgi:hypothetical protein